MESTAFRRRLKLALGSVTAWTLLLSGATPASSLPRAEPPPYAPSTARAKGAPKPAPAQKAMSAAERRTQVREDKANAVRRDLGGTVGKSEQKPASSPQVPKTPKQAKAGSSVAAAATLPIVRALPDDFRVLGSEGSTRGLARLDVGTGTQFSGQVFPGETVTLSTGMLNSESKYVGGKYVDAPHRVKVTWKISCGGAPVTIDKGQIVTAPSSTYYNINKTIPVPHVSTEVVLTPELCPDPAIGNEAFAYSEIFKATAVGEVLDDSNPAAGDRTGSLGTSHRFAASIPDAETDGCLTDCSLTGFAQPQTVRNGSVNTATGAFSLGATDLTQATAGGGWTAARHYSSHRGSSASPGVGSMGRGWSLPWESTLKVNNTTNDAVYVSPTGSVHRQPPWDMSLVRCCKTPSTSRAWLNALQDYEPLRGYFTVGYYLTTPFDKRRIFFDLSGRLTKNVDLASGNGESYTYGSDGRVSSIEAWSSAGVAGRIVTLKYTGDRLTQIERSDGSKVDYAYTDGLLTSATSGGRTVSYGYDASSRLNSVKDGSGQEKARNTYNGQGRVISQTGPTGAVTSFAYNGGTTDTTMPDGGVWTDVYSSNHLIFQYDPFGNRNEYTYNTNSDVTRIADDAGNVVFYKWDNYGPLREITDASGTAKLTWSRTGVAHVEYPGGSKPTTYTYDSQNRVISAKDVLGNTSTFSWTAAGQLASETTPLGKTTSYTYDAAGNRTSVTTPLGAKTTFTYNTSGKPLTVTEPRGNVAGANPADFTTTYTYDVNDLLTSVRAPNGKTTSSTYDGAGNITKSTDAAGRETKYTYDSANRLTSTTLPGGAKSTVGYDTMGLVTARTDVTGAKTTYTYDKAGRVVSMTTPRGNAEGADPAKYTWKYGYDKAGNQTTVTDPEGRTTKTDYDASSRPVAVTDPLGNVTKSSYNASGRVVANTDALEKSTSYTYDAASRLTAVKDPNGNSLTYAYDAGGNRVSETSPLGFKTTYGYDADGRQTSRTEPRGNVAGATPGDFTWRTEYDLAGNATAEIDPFGKKTTSTYDALDNLITSTDPNGKQTSYAYDDLNRLVQTTSPDGGVTKAAFDTAGNVISRTDANQRVTTYEYDKAGRRTKVTDPLERSVRYEYDLEGKRTKTVNARGQSMNHAYDARGLLTSTAYSDGTPEVTYIHDDAGRLNSVIDGTGWRSIWYDKASRPLKVWMPDTSNAFVYTYRADGSISSVTYPDHRETLYTYDADGRMTRQSQKGKNTDYTWDQAGNLLTTTLPTAPAITEARTYDRAGRLASISEGAGTRQFTRDDSGRVTTEALKTSDTTGLAKRFAYDDAGRLNRTCTDTTGTGSCLPGTQGERYTYDKVGNRLTAASGATVTTNTYDAADQLTESTTGTTVNIPAYDADGNQTKDATGTYAYDALGRMKSATIGTDDYTFAYDADGNRTSVKKNQTLHRRYEWDINGNIPRLATERDGEGVFLGDYYYGPHGEPQSLDTWWKESFYFLHDRQNSVTSVRDKTGTETYGYTYGTWGAATGTAGGGEKMPSPFGFNGAPKDAILDGRIQHPARSYDPGSGRFTTQDPRPDTAAPTTTSTYAYSNNDPVNQSDPTGACPICVSIGVGAIIGGVVEGGIYSWQHRNEGFTLGGLAKATGKGALIGGMAGALMPGAGSIAARSLGFTGARALATSAVVNAGVGAGFSYAVNQAQCRPTGPLDLALGAGGGAVSSLMGPAARWIAGRLRPAAQVPPRFGPGAAHADDPALKGAGGFNVNSITEEAGFRYLYRGLSVMHPGYDDAVRGVAKPRGGSASMEAHHNNNTQSIYTSWDTNRNTALQYARGAAEGRSDLPGVILQVKLPLGQPIYPSMMFSSDLWEGTENLVEGMVRGAKVWHVPAS